MEWWVEKLTQDEATRSRDSFECWEGASTTTEHQLLSSEKDKLLHEYWIAKGHATPDTDIGHDALRVSRLLDSTVSKKGTRAEQPTTMNHLKPRSIRITGLSANVNETSFMRLDYWTRIRSIRYAITHDIYRRRESHLRRLAEARQSQIGKDKVGHQRECIICTDDSSERRADLIYH